MCAFNKQGFGLFPFTARMNNSRVYLEAGTISGPLSLSFLSVGLLFTCAQTKQVFGGGVCGCSELLEQLLKAMPDVKKLFFGGILTQFLWLPWMKGDTTGLRQWSENPVKGALEEFHSWTLSSR